MKHMAKLKHPTKNYEQTFVWVLLLLLVCAVWSEAATYYMSPAGADSHPGTSDASPWKTFGYALPRLRAGDVLLLMDGTYTKETTGLPYMNCAGGTASGTAAQPITFKAQHERKALLQGSGNNVLQLDNCAYWVIEGIYSRNVDAQVSGY